MKRLYARIALSPLRRRPDALPDRELTRSVEVDRAQLAAYDRVCGFRLHDELPPTHPHVLAFPLAMDLMTGAEFPFGVLGLVHVANRIEQERPLRADERFELRVRAADLRPHDRGTQFDIVTEAAGGAWRERSTYLRRTSGGGGGGGSGGPPEPRAVWSVPGDIGRRYARVSGDSNPIHLHPISARLLGQPGAIAHGMWTKARCLAALEGSLPGAYAVEVRFKAPLRIPSRVTFTSRGGEFAVWSDRPHLEGRLEPALARAARRRR